MSSATATSLIGVVSVNPIPAVAAITGGNTMCTGTPLTLSDATTAGGTYVWSSSNTATATINSSTGVVTGLVAGTTNITYTFTNSATTCSTVAVNTVTVNTTPSFSVTPSSSAICAGATVSLSVLPVSGTAFSENFESTSVGGIPTGWTSGGAGPYYFNVVTAPETWSTTTVNTAAGSSKYMWVRPVSSPFATTATITTPAFSLAGYSAANLSYIGFYDVGTSETVVAQISTSGPTGTFTTVYTEANNWTGAGTYSTASFPRSIDLSAYVGQPNVAIRWSYTTSNGWAYILDNISVTGTATTPIWVKSDGTFSDLYTTAAHTTLLGGTPAASAFVYNATPATYTYYGQKNGCNSPYGATVTVNPMPDAGSITGTPEVCTGSNTALTDVASGGVWSSIAPAFGTVSTAGIVSGISAGTTTVSYTVTSLGCTSVATQVVTVDPLPVVSAITGPATICQGDAVMLEDVTLDGTWSSDNESVATIDATGKLDGVSSGTANIIYSVTSAAGCTSGVSVNVTVNPLPAVPAIAGVSSLCFGDNTILTDADMTGTWLSDNEPVASLTSVLAIGYSATLVTGVSAGTANIFYTETNEFGCTASAILAVTVNSLPVVPDITGSTTVCLGQTSQLSDLTTGGTWTSDAPGIIDVDGTGLLSGVSLGVTNITYMVTSDLSCSNYATTTVTVNPLPSPISGIATICGGGTMALTDADGDGSWSSSNSNASVDPLTGAVAGVSAGTSTITYTLPTGCIATGAVTITPTPTASPVNDGPICFGGTVNLTANGSGGTTNYLWIGSNLSSTTLANTSATPGSATTYSLAVTDGTTNSGCSSSYTTDVIVNTFGIVAGNDGPACVGGVVDLTATSTGIVSPINYNWSGPSGYTSSVSNPVLSGVTTAATGIYTLHATAGSGCSATSTTSVVIRTLGVTASNSSPVCVGANVNLHSTLTGTASPVSYSWSGPSSYTSISASPLLSGVSSDMAGTYSVVVTASGSGCVASSATNVVVNTIGIIASNDGPACVGGTINFTSTPSGTAIPTAYMWSGPTFIPGVQNPVLGSASVGMSGVYSVTVTSGPGCSATATTTVVINTFGVSASNDAPVCEGGTVHLSANGTTTVVPTAYLWHGPAGYTAPDENPVIAGITTTMGGVYTVTASAPGSGCIANATTNVPVTGMPSSILGAAITCVGSSSTLSDATTGGTWSSSVPAVATIGSTGASRTLTGISAGTSTISYVTGTGCAATLVVTVNPTALITGMAPVCVGSSVSLSTDITGGTWSSMNPSHATVDATFGMVTGVSNGTAVIAYALPSGCTATAVVTVNASPTSIGGIAKTCLGSATTLNDVGGGGVWSSSNPAVGTINTTTGLSVAVTGVGLGTTTISYTTATGCAATMTVTVNPIYPINGSTSLCIGSALTLSDDATGGSWSTTRPLIASAGSTSGIVTGLATGTATIVYTTFAGCTASTLVTVLPTPSSITGIATVCIGSSSALTDATTGGTWSSGNANASIDVTGVITGAAAGTATISYTLTNGCAATKTATVNGVPAPLGSTELCAGSTTTLTDVSGGGTWSSSTVGVATIGLTSGLVTGVAGGTATITYVTGTGGCSTTTIVTIDPISPISGNTMICIGGSSDLGDASGGGAWSSSDATISVVGSTGVVTGLSGGTAIITYTIPGGCSRTASIIINPAPTPISGTLVVCQGATTSLSDGGSGSWTSGSASVATVSGSTGIVTGVSGGTATVTYTAGAGCIATAAVTVNPAPSGIGGAAGVCIGATISLSDFTSGGTWTTASTNVTIGGSGSVTGVSSGTAIITYTLLSTGCFITRTINVNPLPTTILGNTTVCPGAVTFLSDATSGGTSWTSSNTSVATVNASGSVTGLTLGTTSITYTLGTGCTIATTVTVTSMPLPVTGSAPVCPGSTVALTDASGIGSWSSNNTAIATVDAGTGFVTGVSSGMATITYLAGGAGCIATAVVTVSPLTAIYGTMSMCPGAAATLHNTTIGGTWSSTSGNVTVGSATGVVTGVAAGTATVTYSLASGCFATAVVTVNPVPGALTGNAPVCAGTSITLGETATGGTWNSSNTRATVDASGNVTGVSAGAAIISYTLPTGCLATATVTINAAPGSINGLTTVCIGSTVSLSDAVVGGAWSSSTSAASVGSTGVVTGLSSGTSTISYTLATGCSAATILTVVDVPPAVLGNAFTCVGSATNLSDVTAGGSWSSSNSTIASVGSLTGVVNGMAAGTATISYMFGSGCSSRVVVTVTAIPAAITGTASVCSGATTSLTDATAGGTWSTSDASMATVGGTGIVSGVGSAGTATISYSVGLAGCSNIRVVTINPAPGIITGTPSACVGAVTGLTDATTGGVWTSVPTTIATVGGSTGIVTGVAAGTAKITYSSSGCSNTLIITVNALPSAIGGATSVCAGASISLSDNTAGGTWTSAGDASIVSGGTTATVTGISAGTATVTYTLPTGCFKTYAETVKPIPTPILGTLVVCGTGSVTFLSDLTAGTSWTISPVGTATVSASGRVYGVATGTATVTYTGTNGCIVNAVVTVDALPVVSPITGPVSVVHLSSITLSDVTSGGLWSSTTPTIGSIGSTTGIVTGVATTGTTTISYTVADGLGCKAAATRIVTVTATTPHAIGSTVSGTMTLHAGGSVDLNDENANGVWSSSNASVATVNDAGVVTGVSAGIADISHVATKDDGEVTTSVTPVIVDRASADLRIVPNPNNGTFAVRGTLGSAADEEVTIEVTDVLGQVVYKNNITAQSGKVNEIITLNSILANGMYNLNVHSSSDKAAFHFVIER